MTIPPTLSQTDPKERSLLAPDHENQLQNLQLVKYSEPTRGANATARILKTLLATHNDDFSKIRGVESLGVNAIAALVKWAGGNYSGRATNARRSELSEKWADLVRRQGEVRVREKAAECQDEVTVTERNGGVGDYEEEDEEEDEEEQGGDGVDADHRALMGREFSDLTSDLGDSTLRVVEVVSTAAGVMARVHPSDKPLPANVSELEEVPADDLCDSDTFEWTDGLPGRASVAAAHQTADEGQGQDEVHIGVGQVQAQLEPSEEEAAVEGKSFTDADDPASVSNPLTIYAVRSTPLPPNHPKVHLGYIIAAHCHYSDTLPLPHEQASDIWYPVEELLSDPSITWCDGFTPQTKISERFADLELAALHAQVASVGHGDGEGEEESEREPAVVEVTGEGVDCLDSTARVLPYNDRRRCKFFEEVTVTLSVGAPGGGGEEEEETRVLRRLRDFGDDTALVIIDGEGEVSTVRPDDFVQDSDGDVWVVGCCMYSKGDLPHAFVSKLPFQFDGERELVEGINSSQWLLADVVMFRRVVASRELAEEVDCCHQLNHFVDDDPNRVWKLASPKERPKESPDPMEVEAEGGGGEAVAGGGAGGGGKRRRRGR